MKRRLVVDRDLFTGNYVAPGKKEDMTMKDLHVAVWLAGVIDVMRAVSASAAVETPVLIDRTDTQPAPIGPPIGLSVRDPLTSVFGYLLPALEAYRGKATLTFYG